MSEQRHKPIVFRCPATGIDVISPVRVDAYALCQVEDRPLILPCFCGTSHAVHMKPFEQKKRTVRRMADVPTGSAS